MAFTSLDVVDFTREDRPDAAPVKLRSYHFKVSGDSISLYDFDPPYDSIAKAWPDLSLGSYPFFSPAGYGSQLVIRGRDLAQVEAARRDLEAALAREGIGNITFLDSPGD